MTDAVLTEKPDLGMDEYQYGFHEPTDNYVFRGKKGINRDVVAQISAMKKEPAWMRDFRLEALDIFFQKSMLDRKTTNATKAVAQTFSHVVRAVYFGTLSGVGDLPLGAIVPAILLAIAGTSLAPCVIERMTDHGFRQWSRAIIFAISVVFLARAAWLLWHA